MSRAKRGGGGRYPFFKMGKREEKGIFPPLVLVAFGVAAWVAAAFVPFFDFDVPYVGWVALFFALEGIGWILGGWYAFWRAKTTVDPRHPERVTRLVTHGVFRVSRNPMYLGMVLILVGWAMGLGNLLSLFCVPFFGAYIRRYQIDVEERALLDKFGDDYLVYVLRVRRWL